MEEEDNSMSWNIGTIPDSIWYVPLIVFDWYPIQAAPRAPPPSEHLGFFCRNQKTHFFASFATNGNTARVKISVS